MQFSHDIEKNTSYHCLTIIGIFDVFQRKSYFLSKSHSFVGTDENGRNEIMGVMVGMVNL